MELTGKSVLLTGATGGLGRAMAVAIAAAGAELLLSARKKPELEALASELPAPAGGGSHRTFVADLAEEGAGEELIEAAGEIDVLIANAGIGGGDAIEGNKAEVIAQVVRVNYEVPVRMSAAALGPMKDRGAGQIVLISSLAGKAVPSGSALYASTKSAVRAFGIGLRKDLHGTGVGVSVVCPGFIREAGMFADSGREPPAGMGTATPDEVAEAVLEAIREDRGEIDVAPLRQRGMVQVAHHMPRVMAQLERRLLG